MYSVVMMMALSGGAEAPDFGRHGCCSCSCSGYVGCSGCFGCSGCHSRHRLFGGHHRQSCCGCSSSYGCSCSGYGGCSGCSGYGGCMGCSGYVGCSGCSGYGGCMGCTGGYGCAGCAGGYAAPVMGTPVVPGKTPEKVGPPAKTELETPATILVTLPAEAKLFVDGAVTTSTSTERRLVSPALQPGYEYHYTLTAEIARAGQAPIRQTQRITVRAGEETRVPFTFVAPTVTASR